MTSPIDDGLVANDPLVLAADPEGGLWIGLREGDKDEAESIIERYKNWKCTEKIMDLAVPNGIYMHCLPADRGFEVSNSVMDKTDGPGWTSAIFDQAENRLHI